jgi:hypothetical protein
MALKYIPAHNIFITSQVGGHNFDMLSHSALLYIINKNTEESIIISIDQVYHFFKPTLN